LQRILIKLGAILNLKATSSLAVLCAITLGVLSGCAKNGKLDPIDEVLGLGREDYDDLTPAKKPRAKEEIAAKEPPIPQVSDILSTPSLPEEASDKLVSISVTEDVPLKDVLIELSRLADIDLELDPDITGGIIFRATNRPFADVIERICDMAKLKYTYQDGVLKVEVDTPQVQNYQLGFLNFNRSSQSNMSINTNVLSSSSNGGGSGGGSGGGGEGGGLNSGSTSSITATGQSDFWDALERSIQNIIYSGMQQGADPNNPGAAQAAIPAVPQAASAGAGAAGASAAGGVAQMPVGMSDFYVLNKQAGLLTAKTTERKHKRIAEYITKLRNSASAQVLIEAKIIEVTLNKDYETGIDWRTAFPSGGGRVDISSVFSSISDTTNNLAVLRIPNTAGYNLSGAVGLTERFGSARTLSSPRINAINNQPAVLTFAENKVYFDIDVERERDTSTTVNNEIFTVDSEIKTVPIGIILTILPSVDSDSGEITLNVRPTLSRITGFVDDPAIAFLSSQTAGVNIPQNRIPEVEVREIDSIMKLQSGDIMIMGGIMEQRNSNNDRGIPYVGRIPVIGNAFKSVNKSSETVEVVIFIKATVINSGEGINKFDRELYNKYTTDPRPLAF
jgi:general secretion pathway protein D